MSRWKLNCPRELDPRWASVAERNRAADGTFYYSVRTTGVYCRPSCAARLANSANVQFHASIAEAERAGLQPCKRCKPEQPSLDERHAPWSQRHAGGLKPPTKRRASKSWLERRA